MSSARAITNGVLPVKPGVERQASDKTLLALETCIKSSRGRALQQRRQGHGFKPQVTRTLENGVFGTHCKSDWINTSDEYILSCGSWSSAGLWYFPLKSFNSKQICQMCHFQDLVSLYRAYLLKAAVVSDVIAITVCFSQSLGVWKASGTVQNIQNY